MTKFNVGDYVRHIRNPYKKGVVVEVLTEEKLIQIKTGIFKFKTFTASNFEKVSLEELTESFAPAKTTNTYEFVKEFLYRNQPKEPLNGTDENNFYRPWLYRPLQDELEKFIKANKDKSMRKTRLTRWVAWAYFDPNTVDPYFHQNTFKYEPIDDRHPLTLFAQEFYKNPWQYILP